MLADIEKCVDPIGRRSHHDDRLARYIEGHVVANVRDLLEPASDLPYPRPQALILLLEKLL